MIAPNTDWLAERARQSPDAPALECDAARLNYAELDARVARRAADLRARGVRPGDRVALLQENGAHFVEWAHAIWRCAAVLLPLSWRWRPRELAHALGDAEPRLLLLGAGLVETAREALRGLDPTPELADADAEPGEARGGLGVPLTADAPSALLYTSGTGGAPKGALLSRGALSASAAASARHLGSDASDRWLVCMPLFHVGGLSILVRSVLAGASAIVLRRFDVADVEAALDRATQVSLVPTQLERLLAQRGARPAAPGLRRLLLGGSAAPAELVRRAEALGFPVATTYGLTEACSQVATFVPGSGRSAADAPLTPLPGTELRILDERGEPLPAGRTGEIAIRSPALMLGYWRRPDATRRALANGWLRSGDIGRLERNGLRVLDRRADLIVSGGENVYPAEIERVLESHPGVMEAGVVACRDREFGQRPVAWVVRKAACPVASDELLDYCRERLAAYKVPVELRYREESLPRNAAGKLLRRQLAGPRAR